MDQLQSAFWAAPPVSRTITALTFIQSALVYSGMLSGYYVVFLPSKMLKLFVPEIWRLATPFLLTGPQLSFFFDLYFLYHYGTALETSSPRFSQPGDFFIFVMFVAFNLMLTAGFLVGNMIFTSPLIMSFIYIYAQDNRGRKTSFWFIQIPVEMLPWAMLVVTLVLAGPAAVLSDAMGIVAAHLYDFLTRIYPTFGGGQNFIYTPAPVRRFLTKYTPNAGTTRPYGSAFNPRTSQPPPSSSSGGWTSSIQNPWSSRGAGRRLGGD
ncbi:hypothetical protein N7495_008943 [Penicillium taxi]|uniref:uncharacterized protein n=1 Tax=Penicillium taxi TaxID=168475 RepID=UPI002545B5F2|nr:uncharacterized protein N7495_008943 [Penicillium taxi]KAJ5888902.1 hypothetical protein N7495_008943 [Penicillium taxi]